MGKSAHKVKKIKSSSLVMFASNFQSISFRLQTFLRRKELSHIRRVHISFLSLIFSFLWFLFQNYFSCFFVSSTKIKLVLFFNRRTSETIRNVSNHLEIYLLQFGLIIFSS